jgi:hypothetical protein
MRAIAIVLPKRAASVGSCTPPALLLRVPPVATNEQRLFAENERRQRICDQLFSAIRWIAQTAHEPEKAGVQVFVVSVAG